MRAREIRRSSTRARRSALRRSLSSASAAAAAAALTSSGVASSSASWMIAATRRPSCSTAVQVRPEPGAGQLDLAAVLVDERLAVGEPVGDRQRAVADALGQQLADRALLRRRGGRAPRACRRARRPRSAPRAAIASTAQASGEQRAARTPPGGSSGSGPRNSSSPSPTIAPTPSTSELGVNAIGATAAAMSSAPTGRSSTTSAMIRQRRRSDERVQRAAPQRVAAALRLGQRREVRPEQPVGLAAVRLGERLAGGQRADHEREADPDQAEQHAERRARRPPAPRSAPMHARCPRSRRGPRTRPRSAARAAAAGDRARLGGRGHPLDLDGHVAGAGQRLDLERRVVGGGHARARCGGRRRSRRRAGSGRAARRRARRRCASAARAARARTRRSRSRRPACARARSAKPQKPPTAMSPVPVSTCGGAAVAREAHVPGGRPDGDAHVVGHGQAVGRRADVEHRLRAARADRQHPARRRAAWRRRGGRTRSRPSGAPPPSARSPPPTITASALAEVQRDPVDRATHGVASPTRRLAGRPATRREREQAAPTTTAEPVTSHPHAEGRRRAGCGFVATDTDLPKRQIGCVRNFEPSRTSLGARGGRRSGVAGSRDVGVTGREAGCRPAWHRSDQVPARRLRSSAAACAAACGRSSRRPPPRSRRGTWRCRCCRPEQPLFAPIAAVIALGATTGSAAGGPFELVGGVILGIAVADLIVARDRHRARGRRA